MKNSQYQSSTQFRTRFCVVAKKRSNGYGKTMIKFSYKPEQQRLNIRSVTMQNKLSTSNVCEVTTTVYYRLSLQHCHYDVGSSLKHFITYCERAMFALPLNSYVKRNVTWFKKLEILPIPSLYIYSLMLFLVDNLHYF
jgi:hypothetical protein